MPCLYLHPNLQVKPALLGRFWWMTRAWMLYCMMASVTVLHGNLSKLPTPAHHTHSLGSHAPPTPRSPSDYYSAYAGASSCEHCPTNYASDEGSSACTLWYVAHLFRPRWQAQPSLKRGGNTHPHANPPLSISGFFPCPLGADPDVCEEETCEACPDGAQCPGGDFFPVPKEGFWASYDSAKHAPLM